MPVAFMMSFSSWTMLVSTAVLMLNTPCAAVFMIDGSRNQIAGSQALERAGCRRPVQRDIGCQRGLIGGFPHGERGKQAVLQRGHLELTACFLEQGDMNLMQPPDQESWSL